MLQKEEEEVRIKIAKAVISEFSKSGAKFTMDDVAKSLKMSKKTLYTIYPDKESMLMDAVTWGFLRIKESESMILSSKELSLIEKIKKMIIVLPDYLKTLDYSRFPELKVRFPKVYQMVEEHLETQWEQTFSLLTQAIEQKLIKPVSYPVFKSIVTGAMESFLTKSILTVNGVTYQEAVEEMMNILMYGITCKGEGSYGA